MRLICGDCLDVLPTLPDESMDLIFCDPPYNIGVFSKMPPVDYLYWCAEWIAECSRVLAANGALWVSHKDPGVLVELSRMIVAKGRGCVNWVTWDKLNGNPAHQACGGPLVGMTEIESLRSFQVMAEYLIYHADEGEWTHQCDRERGFIFEPLRAYLEAERQRAGVSKEDINEWLGFRRLGGMAGRHYFSRSQWCLPTPGHYHKMRECFHSLNEGGEYLRRDYEYLRRDYEDLRRDYEDLRRDYEDLRYTFNNPGKVSSVWQIPPAPSNGHPTPKPEALLERIILATSNPGDLVLDPFMGSGTTGAVAARLGRDFTGIDIDEKWVSFSEKRISETQAQPALEGLG